MPSWIFRQRARVGWAARPSLLASPARVFGDLALAEIVTWAALLAAMAADYLLEGPRLMICVSGGVHGFVFLAYALVAVDQRPRTPCGY